MSRLHTLRSLAAVFGKASTVHTSTGSCLRLTQTRLAPGLLRVANHVALRSFSSATADSGLVNILKEEHKYELENYQRPEIVVRGPPSPFTLAETSGDTLLTLTRKLNNEEISVDLHVNNQPQPTGDDGATQVAFVVTIAKDGDKTLVFECESDGNAVDIIHVSFEPKKGLSQESAFSGPVYDELDDKLKGEFSAYLTARGVTAELGEYLRFLVYDKEQREYTAWLKSVADFVVGK